jgi:two-component system chemotaxis sensor kinase CheA
MNDPNVVEEFLAESLEGLEQLDRDLVALEADPRDRERLARIFRTIHNIKGACGFLGFARLEAVSHGGENLLSRLRDGRLRLRPEVTTALLALVDAVRAMLASIGATGGEGARDDTALLATLTALQEEGEAAPAAEEVPPGAETAPARPATPAPDGSAGNIRVDVGRLDKLMNLVGELVLARNQILQYTAARQDAAFLAGAQRLDRITTELQAGVMKTRMQPIGTVWDKLPRVARDLALACGKQVTLDLEGADTELDRTIIETIKDPLTHLVRNAIDHGIETPAVRQARGKPAAGRLSLRAFHEGGLVHLEIADDGAGVDAERVKRKALERGLITAEQAALLGEADLLHLVFLPGFSTADAVSRVSGRGVGMDVVKTNVEKVGGTVDLRSRPGLGTTLTVKIPLTLAIIPALLVAGAGDRYAIPQASLLELVRLEEGPGRRGVEWIHGEPVYRLRDQLLPLVYLNRQLGVEGAPGGPGPDAVPTVVLQADGRPFGLVVDAVHDTEEIVVKPLGKHLHGIPLFAGATIMGDGRVVLILDVLGLARGAGVLAERGDRGRGNGTAPGPREPGGRPGARQPLLLCGLGDGRRLAVPLTAVARLEEIPRSAAERSVHREVVQYRGRILPLVRLSRPAAGGEPGAGEDPLRVVVCAEQGRQVGLVVDRILDVIEAAAEVEDLARGEGTLGAAVIGGHVTDLVDVPGVVRAAHPAAGGGDPDGR